MTLTLLVDATYRFKDKASIQLDSGFSANVTVVDFAGGAAAEDVDGHTVAAGGTTGGYNVKSNIKSNIDLVKSQWESACDHMNKDVQFHHGDNIINGFFKSLGDSGTAVLDINGKDTEFYSGKIL